MCYKRSRPASINIFGSKATVVRSLSVDELLLLIGIALTISVFPGSLVAETLTDNEPNHKYRNGFNCL